MNDNQLVRYSWGDQTLALSPSLVRDQIAKNQNVTPQECFDFIALCKAQHLNPFIREAYLVKYGSNPATMIVGKDVFTKRAEADPDYDGMDAGVTVITPNGELVRRDGSMVLQGEALVGGWCRVHKKNRSHPYFEEVSLAEYMGKKKDGSPSGQWARMPGTMIRKVALVHALREAFPDRLQGLYDSSEMGIDQANLPSDVIEVEADVAPVPPEPPVEAAGDEPLEMPVTSQDEGEPEYVPDGGEF